MSGEYGFALVYFGPTMVPLGQRSYWLAAFLLWRQEMSFPAYWQEHL